MSNHSIMTNKISQKLLRNFKLRLGTWSLEKKEQIRNYVLR